MESSVVILSGGLDSAVSAAIAKERTRPRLALFFDYGQRAAPAERRAATAIAQHLEIPLRTIGLPWLAELGQSALTDGDRPIPELSESLLDDRKYTEETARAVWVPNRNGVFLNMAAAFAESLEAKTLVTGFNAEEAMTFPDNSEAFTKVAGEFFAYSTYHGHFLRSYHGHSLRSQEGLSVLSYTQRWNKEEIVREGLKRDIPFEVLWSCYHDGERMCSKCESCQRSIRAYKKAGIWERMYERFNT